MKKKKKCSYLLASAKCVSAAPNVRYSRCLALLKVLVAAIISSLCWLLLQALRKKEFKGETADDVMVRI